jgi:hypothetical protein
MVIPDAMDAMDAVVVSKPPIAASKNEISFFVARSMTVSVLPTSARRMTDRSKCFIMALRHVDVEDKRCETRSAA